MVEWARVMAPNGLSMCRGQFSEVVYNELALCFLLGGARVPYATRDLNINANRPMLQRLGHITL